MQQTNTAIEITTDGKGFYEITAPIERIILDAGINSGLVTIFCRHTSASLIIQENADPDVRADLERFFEDLAPEDGGYAHRSEGVDDMPAHIRAALTQTHLSIPIDVGKMVLGTWQGIFLFEHRSAPHRRSVALHVIGA